MVIDGSWYVSWNLLPLRRWTQDHKMIENVAGRTMNSAKALGDCSSIKRDHPHVWRQQERTRTKNQDLKSLEYFSVSTHHFLKYLSLTFVYYQRTKLFYLSLHERHASNESSWVQRGTVKWNVQPLWASPLFSRTRSTVLNRFFSKRVVVRSWLSPRNPYLLSQKRLWTGCLLNQTFLST